MTTLDDLLTSAGYKSGFWQRMRAGTDPGAEHPEQVRALESRGWVLRFDPEGLFHDRGEHARLLAEVLALADLHADRIEDRWEAGYD